MALPIAWFRVDYNGNAFAVNGATSNGQHFQVIVPSSIDRAAIVAILTGPNPEYDPNGPTFSCFNANVAQAGRGDSIAHMVAPSTEPVAFAKAAAKSKVSRKGKGHSKAPLA